MKISTCEAKRREAGMTKADLARASEIQPNIITWLEAGRFRPYPQQLERIASALGVDDPESLMDEIEVTA